MEAGLVDAAVIPIENSIKEEVNQNSDLLFAHDPLICGEVVSKIDQSLIPDPGMGADQIKAVHSHPQALVQCGTFLLDSGRRVIPDYDAAKRARMIKEKGLVYFAAVASERAVRICAMKILSKEMANAPNNYTRFSDLSKAHFPPSGKNKTSIVMSVKPA